MEFSVTVMTSLVVLGGPDPAGGLASVRLGWPPLAGGRSQDAHTLSCSRQVYKIAPSSHWRALRVEIVTKRVSPSRKATTYNHWPGHDGSPEGLLPRRSPGLGGQPDVLHASSASQTGLGLLNGPGHPQRLRGTAVTQRFGQRIRTDDSGGNGAGGRWEQPG